MPASCPAILYGTAWKKERTRELVVAALTAGFRGIDTANQRRHYWEADVGSALREVWREGRVARGDIFIQTKFTHLAGQGADPPYDPHAPVAHQVAQSVDRSLKQLGVERLDALLLHGPSAAPGLGPEDHEAWTAMEDAQREGRTRLLGVSNVNRPQLEELLARAHVQPAVVQNRTFTRPASDRDVRALCRKNGILYQGFSLLTAIPPVVGHPLVGEIAANHGLTRAQVILGYCMERNIVVLTGTTSLDHMRQDLDVAAIRLGADLARLDTLLGLA